MKIRRVKSFEYDFVRLMMLLNIWWIGCNVYKNPFKSAKIVKELVHGFKKMIGGKKLIRAFKIDNKYAWDMFNPSWPSKAFDSFFKSHLLEIEPISNNDQVLRRLLIAITKRCPLQCEHCSEASTLYNKDILSYENFIEKMEPFVQGGVGQLVYSGGEPLVRFDDLLKFLSHFKSRCDQWIYTSAYGLSLEKAILLKKSGLNGAAISLDHHLESKHNDFRGNSNSFYWVMEGVKNLQKAGVFVAFNVCVTKTYIASGTVEQIVYLAKDLNVPLINLLEPRAVGNYQDKDVELNEAEHKYLSNMSNKYNFDKKFFAYPTVLFPAAYRKSMPCGGGKSYLLLDYDGTLYPCPFCKVKMPAINNKLNLCEAS